MRAYAKHIGLRWAKVGQRFSKWEVRAVRRIHKQKRAVAVRALRYGSNIRAAAIGIGAYNKHRIGFFLAQRGVYLLRRDHALSFGKDKGKRVSGEHRAADRAFMAVARKQHALVCADAKQHRKHARR